MASKVFNPRGDMLGTDTSGPPGFLRWADAVPRDGEADHRPPLPGLLLHTDPE